MCLNENSGELIFTATEKTCTSYLVRPAAPPQVFYGPRLRCSCSLQSLQLFHLLWSKRFAPHVLQDPNDKDVKIKFIDYFQPPFPGKLCVFFVFFGVTGKVFFTEWLLFSPIAKSRFGGLVRDEQINLGWQFKQIWMLLHDP